MAIQTSAGASLSIAATQPADFLEATVAALTYVKVGQVTNIGRFGKQFELVTLNTLDNRGTIKRKGSFNNGTLDPQMALDLDDAGQVIMETAQASDNPYAFKIQSQSGLIWYVYGLVMAFDPNIGTSNDWVMAETSIELSSEYIFREAAA